MHSHHDVLIVGGGPAGLAAAFWHQRKQAQARILVCEASQQAGGRLRSERRQGYLCEAGPQAVRPNEDFDELIAALGIESQLVPAAASATQRWIGRGGQLLAAPTGPLSFLTTRLLSCRGKWRLLREPRAAAASSDECAQESVSDFCVRRFGPETKILMQAMVGGVFAGDADRLEINSTFPMLAELERQHGSVVMGLRHRRRQRRQQTASDQTSKQRPALMTFRGGMQDLSKHLSAAVGDRLVCNRAVKSVHRSDGQWSVVLSDGSQHITEHLVLACSARISAKLLAIAAPELASELAGISFASLASVYLGIPVAQAPRKLRGFGFLLTSERRNPVLGAIYASQAFPDHAPTGHQLLRVMLGGALHPETVTLSDDRLIALATAAVAQYTDVTTAPTFTHVVRCPDAIPQYERGHAARLQRIRALLEQQHGLRLLGNSYEGVAVTAQLGRQASSCHHARPSEQATSGSDAERGSPDPIATT